MVTPSRQDRRSRRALLAWAAVAALGVLGPGAAGAQAPTSAPDAAQTAPTTEDDRRYSEDVLRQERALSSEVMSPFCPGRTLINCSSDQARAYREAFKGFLKSGISPAELKADFERRWGDVSRSTPKSWLGWAIPGVLLLLGAGGVFYALRRFRNEEESEGSGGSAAPVSRELQDELDRELRARGL